MHAGSTDNWVVLSNRLLLLQEIMVGLSQLPPAEVVQRSAEGVTWIFDGGALHALRPDELVPLPLITRGRTRVSALGEVYLAYFAGPPEPLYLALSGADLADPQEFRLVALYFEHLLAALSAAGYREELARQARTDWLTGLANRRSLARRLDDAPEPRLAVGLLEVYPQGARAQAERDVFQKRLARTLLEALPEGGWAFHAGSTRIALLVPEAEVSGLESALERAGLEAVWGWARQRDLAATTVGALFEAAEARLEALLGAAPGRGERAGISVRAAVTVQSGLEQVQKAVQERVRGAPPGLAKGRVRLLLDTPLGFALEVLTAADDIADGGADGAAPATLIVTESTSPPYLRNLLAQKPQGLVVGSPDDAALASALERVLEGEPFYDGPVLGDDDLYPREREVWRLLVRGQTNAQIAATLGISEKTVANYVTNLQDKLFLRNRVELVLYYLGKLERSE